MPQTDFKDLVIRGKGHPKYESDRIVEDRTIEFIIQKIENILFTNKGDVLGDIDFGANLEYYLWSTNVPLSKIERIIREQIDTYIPELNSLDYSIDCQIFEGSYRDILYINIKINDTKINFIFK